MLGGVRQTRTAQTSTPCLNWTLGWSYACGIGHCRAIYGPTVCYAILVNSLDSNTSICAVFFDLTKAFYTVPHQLLLRTLASLKVFPLTYFAGCLTTYYNYRTQQVSVSRVLSSKVQVTSGIPQGSIFGPLLFSLYITFSPSSTITLYTDDILIPHPIISHNSLREIQSDIDLMLSWTAFKLLTTNNYMIVTRNPSSFPSLPSLFLNGVPLEHIKSFKYIGIVLTHNLLRSPHKQAISSKARKLTGLIYHKFYKHLSPHYLLNLYKVQDLPHLTYCSTPPQRVQFTSCRSGALSHTQRLRTARDSAVYSITAMDCVYTHINYTISILKIPLQWPMPQSYIDQ